jgi:phage terminase large subunit
VSRLLINKNLFGLMVNHERDIPATTMVLEGGSRSGKTWSIIEYLASLMLQKKDLQIAAFRSDRSTCEDTIIADFHKVLALKGWTDAFKWCPSPLQYGFKCIATGAFIRFRGTSDPQKLHGAACDIAWLNEVMEISYKAYMQIKGRTRFLMILDFNPSFSHHWLFEKLLNGADQDTLKRGKTPDKVGYIHSTFVDNPHLKEERASILSFEPTVENIQAGTADQWHWDVYGLGKRGLIEGAVYSNFGTVAAENWPLRNAFHVHGFAVDFASAHNAAVLEMGYQNNQIWIRELANCPGLLVTNSPSNPNLPSIEQALLDGGCGANDRVYCDPAANQSILQLRAAGLMAISAKKGDVLDGIRTMQGYRINIHEDSMLTYGQFQRYRFPPGANGFLKAKPIKEDDDAPDAARYWAVSELGHGHPVLNQVKRKSRDAS